MFNKYIIWILVENDKNILFKQENGHSKLNILYIYIYLEFQWNKNEKPFESKFFIWLRTFKVLIEKIQNKKYEKVFEIKVGVEKKGEILNSDRYKKN